MTKGPQGASGGLLVTGFGRYPGVRVNPTAELTRRVAAKLKRRHGGFAIHHAILTVSHAKARHELAACDAAHQPDAILMLGLAACARWVRVERFARTLDSPLHPDAEGRGGGRHAAARDLPLPATGQVQPALHALLKRGIQARLSASAGRYLCNAVYAAALERAQGRPVLFLHVPYARGFRRLRPSGKGRPSQPAMRDLEQALADIATQLSLQARRLRLAQPGMA